MRGVLWIIFPGEDMEALLARSQESVLLHHPELKQHVVRLPEGSTLLDKCRMFDLSPFEETLFLDADTVVLDRLDFGFDMALKHGVACCICECPWARRFTGLLKRGDMVEYNTGVIFFTKRQRAQTLFSDWQEASLELGEAGSSLTFVGKHGLQLMPLNDQASFAMAASETSPFALPLNWNFRPIWHKTFFGPLKVWHDKRPVPEGMDDWQDAQTKEEGVIQFNSLS